MTRLSNKAKIIRVAGIFRTVLFAGLVLWSAMILASLFTAVVALWKGTSATTGSGFLQYGSPLLPALSLMVNWKLFRFFDRLKKGHLFDAQTVKNLDDAGKWWLALWLFEQTFCFFSRSGFSTSGLVPGLILVFAAWLLNEARELQEEKELTV